MFSPDPDYSVSRSKKHTECRIRTQDTDTEGIKYSDLALWTVPVPYLCRAGNNLNTYRNLTRVLYQAWNNVPVYCVMNCLVISTIFINILTFCIIDGGTGTVSLPGITNVQLKNYKPVTQRNFNVKLTFNQRPTCTVTKEKNWFIGMGRKDFDWMFSFSPCHPQSATY